MNYLAKLIKTSRPLFWFTHFTLLIFGGLQSQTFHLGNFPFALSLIIFSLPLSLYVYVINDSYDLDTDLLNPRKGTIFGNKHDRPAINNLKICGFIGLAVSLLLAGLIGSLSIVAIIILSIAAYLYSAPPIRLKSIPVIDAIVGGGLYFYTVMVVGYLASAGNIAKIADIFLRPFILVALLGLFGQLMGSVLDVEPDKKSGIRTSAVFFGTGKVISFCLLVLFSCLYLVRNNWVFMLFIAALIAICPFAYSAKWRQNFLLQVFGGAFIPLAFFITTIILYIANPNLLRI